MKRLPDNVMGKTRLTNGEENTSTEKFCEGATDARHINREGVSRGFHEKFRGSVILCDYFLGELGLVLWVVHPSETKITDLKWRTNRYSGDHG